MPTCCSGLTPSDGTRPHATITRHAEGFMATVGSAMLGPFPTRDALMVYVEQEQHAQRVFPCGHVVRIQPGTTEERADG